MKRIRIVVCFCLCILIFCSCGRKDPEFVKPANFYYCNRTVSYNTPAGVISPEVRESNGIENNVDKYMEEYLRGPVSDGLYRIIPEDTVLLSAQIQETTALLNFSKDLADLSGIELTTVSVCILKSLNDFTGIETVILSADGSLLDEKETFTLSLEDIVTMDTVTVEE